MSITEKTVSSDLRAYVQLKLIKHKPNGSLHFYLYKSPLNFITEVCS